MKRFSKDIQHYLPLFGILAAGMLGFLLFSYDRNFQSAVIISTAAGYLAWGIVHHHIHGDLRFSIVLEYFTMALLGVILVLSIIFRA